MTKEEKELGKLLVEFYEGMKSLENSADSAKNGKKATLLTMTMNDISDVFKADDVY